MSDTNLVVLEGEIAREPIILSSVGRRRGIFVTLLVQLSEYERRSFGICLWNKRAAEAAKAGLITSGGRLLVVGKLIRLTIDYGDEKDEQVVIDANRFNVLPVEGIEYTPKDESEFEEMTVL